MPSPMNSPQLTRDRQNKYNFSLPDELENYENPSVVFRIETENGLVYYQWMVEVETNFVTATMFNDIKLDLSSYPGQRLNIAYAFATPDAGFTSYSESTEVVVPGTVLYHTTVYCVPNYCTMSDINPMHKKLLIFYN